MVGKRRRLLERADGPDDPTSAIAASFVVGGLADPLQLVTYATTPVSVANAAGAAAEEEDKEVPTES